LYRKGVGRVLTIRKVAGFNLRCKVFCWGVGGSGGMVILISVRKETLTADEGVKKTADAMVHVTTMILSFAGKWEDRREYGWRDT